MSNVKIKSIFEQISEIAFNTADLGFAKQHTIEFVSSKNINDKDKQSILFNIKPSTNFKTTLLMHYLNMKG